MQPITNHVTFDAATRVISLTRRFFFIVLDRKRVSTDMVKWLDAFNRDSLTHDEVFVRLHTEDGGLVVSEFDHGFSDLIEVLTPIFPGIERWNDVTPVIPLREAALTLWERE